MPGKSDDDCGGGRGAEERPTGGAEQQEVALQPPVMDVMGGTWGVERTGLCPLPATACVPSPWLSPLPYDFHSSHFL
jgi:hypothetical protein